jgi:predicted transcriptional regulator
MSNRSSEKKISREAIVLRHMRQTRKLSLNEAGARLGISGSAIAHIEHGRFDVSSSRIKTVVQAYSYTMQEFMDLMESNTQLVSLRDECLSILRQLDELKLSAAHAVLTHLVPAGTTRTAGNPRRHPRQ